MVITFRARSFCCFLTVLVRMELEGWGAVTMCWRVLTQTTHLSRSRRCSGPWTQRLSLTFCAALISLVSLSVDPSWMVC